jgi:hypothetical protein
VGGTQVDQQRVDASLRDLSNSDDRTAQLWCTVITAEVKERRLSRVRTHGDRAHGSITANAVKAGFS